MKDRAIGSGGLAEAGTMTREFSHRALGMHAARPREDRYKAVSRLTRPAVERARWFWERIRSGRFSHPDTVAALTREHGEFFRQFEAETPKT